MRSILTIQECVLNQVLTSTVGLCALGGGGKAAFNSSSGGGCNPYIK